VSNLRPAGRRYRQKYEETAYEPLRDRCPIPLEPRVAMSSGSTDHTS
jgi:hypothetical protein